MSELSAKDQTLLTNTLHETGVFVTCGLETPNIMVTHWARSARFGDATSLCCRYAAASIPIK